MAAWSSFAERPSSRSACANGLDTKTTSKPLPPLAVSLPMISSLVACSASSVSMPVSAVKFSSRSGGM